MGKMFNTRYTLEGISEKLESDNRLTRTWPDLEYISLHEEHSGFPIRCRTSELHHDELLDNIFDDVFFIFLNSIHWASY